MRTETSNQILSYLKKHQQATAHDLFQYLGISRQALFKQLKKLQTQQKITKTGTPPKVFYALLSTELTPTTTEPNFTQHQTSLITDHYLTITPAGQILPGTKGFTYWCEKNGFKPEFYAQKYEEIITKYEKYRQKNPHQLIDGLTKLKTTFGSAHLDELFYLDFYSYEIFGKTKLGSLLLYAKQGQNRKLMSQLFTEIEPKIAELIKAEKITAIGFIPPTVKREVQFMKELSQNIVTHLPRLQIIKIKTDIPVPQKTLSKLNDRIENAQQTIYIQEKHSHASTSERQRRSKNILLIDDAVGSGATINETAKKLRDQKLCTGKIIGLAITGSLKGFDVINEI